MILEFYSLYLINNNYNKIKTITEVFMKKISTVAYIAATVFFIVNAISARLNLNPLYPATAFCYCVMITVYVGIWVINKAGKIIFTRQETGQVSVCFCAQPACISPGPERQKSCGTTPDSLSRHWLARRRQPSESHPYP